MTEHLKAPERYASVVKMGRNIENQSVRQMSVTSCYPTSSPPALSLKNRLDFHMSGNGYSFKTATSNLTWVTMMEVRECWKILRKTVLGQLPAPGVNCEVSSFLLVTEKNVEVDRC